MLLALYGWRFWVLVVLAAAVILGYFGVLSIVQTRLEEFGTSGPISRLASQPRVAESFKDKDGGRMDAYVVMFLFVFLSPLALFMSVVLTIFLLSALATAIGPLIGGERIALLVLEVVAGALVYVKQDLWLPHVAYFLGLMARAYVVITS